VGDCRIGPVAHLPPALASDPVELGRVERQVRARHDALGSAPRPELLNVLTLPDPDRVGAIHSY
jgi:hypothetical protein